MTKDVTPAGWKPREEMEAGEQQMLAPFAQKSGDSRGRKYPESRHAYRTEFQRDRARIIHRARFGAWNIRRRFFSTGPAIIFVPV